MKRFAVMLCVGVLTLSGLYAQENSVSGDDQVEKRWPRVIDISNAVITIFQPQMETLKDNQLTCRAAVSVKRDNKEKVDYCAIWMKASLDTDKETRIVKLKGLEITKIAYPDVSDQVKDSLGGIIRRNILKANWDISLDRLLAMLDVAEKQQKDDKKLESPVPKFFFSTKPAVLVSIDGEPVLKNINDDVSQIINTRFLMLLDVKSKQYYLKCAGEWFSSKDLTDGWQLAKEVPSAISEQGKKDSSAEEEPKSDITPEVYVVTKPAELIQCDGEPELASIPGTDLSYLKNSDNDIFRDTSNNQLYLLVSGRWFTAPVKEGPWKSIDSSELPETFKKIPSDSPKANVLVSVAGTNEAKDAVMESYIPQTATIKRGTVKLDIKYDGEPQFEAIEGTSMSYAVNTETPVVKLNNKYYACDNGAWYESDSPTGDWDVCAKVPDEIYTIPPSCPIYNATFVKVYDVNDDSVDVGYTSGYDDSYVYGGVLVYGTGFCYRLWCRRFWCPRPVTYGCRYRYNRLIARWCRYDRYRARNGKYVAWNNYKNPRLRTLPYRGAGDYRTKQNITKKYNAYKNNKGAIATAAVAAALTSKLAKRSVSSRRRDTANNVYAGKDGKIYKYGLDGWQRQNKGKWQNINKQKLADLKKRSGSGSVTRPVKRPTTRPTTRPVTRPTTRPKTRPTTRPVKRPTTRPSTRDLNRHYKARQRSNYRYKSYSRARSTRSYSRSRSSSRRSSGRSISRGSRGGGRRR
jgi:hypothetical protein